MTGQHRSPPPALRTGWRWHTVAALAGLGILTPPVTLWAQAVAPDATARSQVSTVTRAERTDAGPLVLPTVGVVAPAIESLYPTPSVAPQHTVGASRGTRTSQTAPEALSGPLVAILESSEQTVTPAPQPVTTEQAQPTPTTPLADAAVTTDSATPTPEETPAVTPEPTETTVTVDVTAEVTP